MRGPSKLSGLLPLFAILVTMGGIEWALRTFMPIHLVGGPSAFEYDEELGYRIKPGIHQYFLTDHLQEFRTGPLGNVGFEDDFSGYEQLVFAIGDSYTQGAGNSADASYPFQLDLLLNQGPNGIYEPRFGIVNLGLSAFGTEQSLRVARRYADIVGKPAFVLYFGCDNDWDDDVMFRDGYRHRHLVEGSPKWGRMVGPLLWLSEFELVKRTKIALSAMRMARMRATAAAGNGAIGTPSPGAQPSVAERVWPVLAEIIALSRAWNAIPIVSWANPDTDSYRWLRQKAAAEGIAFADWAPAMRAVQERMPNLPYANSHSGGHWRPWTNGVIAQTYARAMGVWPARAAPPPAPSAR
jgi:hypothetical protein